MFQNSKCILNIYETEFPQNTYYTNICIQANVFCICLMIDAQKNKPFGIKMLGHYCHGGGLNFDD